MHGVSGEMCWHVGKGCGEGNGGDRHTLRRKCVEGWGPNTLLIPHISSLPSLAHLSLHFPLLPPHPITLSYISSHTSSHTSLSSPHTPTYFPTIPTSLFTFSKCDEVSVAKLPCGEVTGNHINLSECIPRYLRLTDLIFVQKIVSLKPKQLQRIQNILYKISSISRQKTFK